MGRGGRLELQQEGSLARPQEVPFQLPIQGERLQGHSLASGREGAVARAFVTDAGYLPHPEPTG